MIFKDIPPSPPLQELVKLIRLRHFVIPENVPINAKPFPPRPEQCIAFYARGYEITEISNKQTAEKRPLAVLSGQYTHRINRLSSPREFLMIQVVFKPGVLHRITGIPFSELCNHHIDLEAVFPLECRMVNERLGSCENYNEMIAIVERFLQHLQSRIKVESRPADLVFDIVAKGDQNYSLDWLASQACLSPRQFERKSEQYLGVNPKLFARIARFDKSYQFRLKNPTLNWLSIALACGYHDYQHLVYDYKTLACVTPNQLFRDESKTLERVLGLNA